jgi:cobalt-zinc-cadmium efflux system protein
MAMTCHLVMPDGPPSDEMLAGTAQKLKEHFGIGHVTLQPEKTAAACHLAEIHA